MNKASCMVCGGDHEPSTDVCDPDGMDRVIAKIGADKWNRLTRPVGLKDAIRSLSAVPQAVKGKKD